MSEIPPKQANSPYEENIKVREYMRLVTSSEGFWADDVVAAGMPFNADLPNKDTVWNPWAWHAARYAVDVVNASMGKNLSLENVIRVNAQDMIYVKLFYLTFETSDNCVFEAKIGIDLKTFLPSDQYGFIREAVHYPEISQGHPKPQNLVTLPLPDSISVPRSSCVPCPAHPYACSSKKHSAKSKEGENVSPFSAKSKEQVSSSLFSSLSGDSLKMYYPTKFFYNGSPPKSKEHVSPSPTEFYLLNFDPTPKFKEHVLLTKPSPPCPTHSSTAKSKEHDVSLTKYSRGFDSLGYYPKGLGLE